MTQDTRLRAAAKKSRRPAQPPLVAPASEVFLANRCHHLPNPYHMLAGMNYSTPVARRQGYPASNNMQLAIMDAIAAKPV
jgi:hypothetical protein